MLFLRAFHFLKKCYSSPLFQYFILGNSYLPSGLQGLGGKVFPDVQILSEPHLNYARAPCLCIHVGSSLGNSSQKVVGISCPFQAKTTVIMDFLAGFRYLCFQPRPESGNEEVCVKRKTTGMKVWGWGKGTFSILSWLQNVQHG